jgi:Capsule assembly protein Wzi
VKLVGAVRVFLLLIPALSAAALPAGAQDQQTATQTETKPNQPPTAPPAAQPPEEKPDQLPTAVPLGQAVPLEQEQPASKDQLPPARSKIDFQGFEPHKSIESFSSPYVPLDSWIYPAMMRLYGMGFVDTEFVGLRPWTRLSIANMLDASWEKISDSNNDEAIGIYDALEHELEPDLRIPMDRRYGRAHLESVYSRVLGISGTPLRDSFHLGQTDINDFGRPYAEGFNSYTGYSALSEYGRFSVYFRGEFQHAPSWAGYSPSLANTLALIDGFGTYEPVSLEGNTTIPLGPISSTNNFTVLEGYVSAHVLGHEISLGKMDNWYGTAAGGGMAWSNNAEDLYSFRINRVEPLYIPYISRIAGLIRYDFYVGPLKGHNIPVSPWVHAEQISFKPTPNFEFGFERTVIWGGIGHEPITLGTFWRSFYSISDTTGSEKFSPRDPGARFSAVNFSWRLPFLTNWLTLYSDSEVHDDVFPITAPRHAAIRPGIYLSHFPGAPKLDLRVEAASTDPDTGLSNGGVDMYTEVVQRNGYTNNGLLMGDWIGRENKGGQAWLTYHLSPMEWLQVSYRGDKAAKDFIPGGTTQNDYIFSAVKRLTPQVELKFDAQYERWLIPVYKLGAQSDTSIAFQLTWYPKSEQRF